MQAGEQVFKKTFEGKNTKDAYMKCCKWIASNIIARNNSRHISYNMHKVERAFPAKVELTVYVMCDEEEVYNHNCEICKEASDLFYIRGQRYKCDSCKINPYRERIKARLSLIKDGMKGVIL